MTKLLTAVQLEKQKKSLDGAWRVLRNGTVLSRTIKTADFLSAYTLLTTITVQAELAQHHPDIEISYGRLKVNLTSHEQGGLTRKDIQLASAIDSICRRAGITE